MRFATASVLAIGVRSVVAAASGGATVSAISHLSAPSRQTTVPARTLLYVGKKEVGELKDFGLWVASLDGVARRLTSSVSDPVWSPDGRWIAFVKRVDHKSDSGEDDYAAVIRADGTGERRLHRSSVFGPTWSPDRQRLVFAGSGGDFFEPSLYTIKRDGSDLRRVEVPPHFDLGGADWSPDGKRLAFNYGNATWVANWTGAKSHRVSTLGDSSWSPDGRWLAVLGEHQIVLVNVAGTRVSELPAVGAIDSAVWKPTR